MPNPQGNYIWYELLTSDPDAAQDFYSKVVGWTFSRPFGGLEREYRILSAADADIGGLMKLPQGAPMPPGWLGYVGVADVDAMAAKVAELGGAIHMPPADIPDVGRFALVADPQGAVFYVMRDDSDRESTAFKPMGEGHCAWNELVTSDQAAALDFYGRLFGWEKGDAMPMDEMGDYRFIDHGGQMIGAVMNRPKDARRRCGTTISASAASTRRPSASAKTAGRSPSAPWRCRAATGWSTPPIRRARCSA